MLQLSLLRIQREILMKTPNHNVQSPPKLMQITFKDQCVKMSCHSHGAVIVFVSCFFPVSLVMVSNKVAFQEAQRFLA